MLLYISGVRGYCFVLSSPLTLTLQTDCYVSVLYLDPAEMDCSSHTTLEVSQMHLNYLHVFEVCNPLDLICSKLWQRKITHSHLAAHFRKLKVMSPNFLQRNPNTPKKCLTIGNNWSVQVYALLFIFINYLFIQLIYVFCKCYHPTRWFKENYNHPSKPKKKGCSYSR